MAKELKILIVDDLPEIRELVTFFLQASMDCSVVTATSSWEAIETYTRTPQFDLVISDLHMPKGHGIELVRHFEKNKILTPILILSGEATNKFPEIRDHKNISWIQKPFSDESLVLAVRKMTHVEGDESYEHTYIPVKLDFLRLIRRVQTPLFVKINAQKYVKISPEDSVFNEEQYNKYKDKSVTTLYIEASQAERFIAEFRKKALSEDLWNCIDVDDIHNKVHLDIELIRNVSTHLGWKDEVLKLAQENIQRVLAIVAQQKDLTKVIQKFNHIEKFGFADQCTLTALVSTCLAKELSLDNPENSRILTFASVFHDMTLSDEQYDHKKAYMQNIRRGEYAHIKDAKEVFAHPAKAAALVRQWDFCPSGVDNVIMNHHESPDGHGFPMGKKAEQVDLLSAVFSVSALFSQFIVDSYGIPELNAFLRLLDEGYQSTPYTQVIDALVNSFSHTKAA